MTETELGPQSGQEPDDLAAIAASLESDVAEEPAAEPAAEPVEVAEPATAAEPADSAPAQPVALQLELEAPQPAGPQPAAAEPVAESVPTAVEVPADSAPAEQASAAPAEPAPAEPAFLGAIDETTPTAAPTWPFVVYEGAWAVFAAAIVFFMRGLPEGPVYSDKTYAASVFAGLILTGLGPVLIFIVWLLSGGTQKGRRGSIFVSSLLKGAVATFLGVVLWITALVILDQLRLGAVL